jgi:hypothetical protein
MKARGTSIGAVSAFVSLIVLACSLWGSDSTAGLTPDQIVRKTVQNEVNAGQSGGVSHVFLSHKKTLHGSQTRVYCETKDAMAGMTLENDGKPLTADQRAQEVARLENLAKNPEELKKKREQEKADADRVSRIVRAMPDAFIFERDGTEPGQSGVGKPGDELIRLKFHPNPNYNPPSHVEQVLEGMEGVLLIDSKQYRIARIDGRLAKEVGFGWGILGHLDKGGHFLVEQADLGDGSWDASRMQLSFTGRILLFKRLEIQSDEVLSNYRTVPTGLTFAQGIDLLKKEEAAFLSRKSGVVAREAEANAKPRDGGTPKQPH